MTNPATWAFWILSLSFLIVGFGVGRLTVERKTLEIEAKLVNIHRMTLYLYRKELKTEIDEGKEINESNFMD